MALRSIAERFIREGGTHILYDGDSGTPFDPAWFDRESLGRMGAVTGETANSGRVPAIFFKAAGEEFVLKHYRRGGAPGRVVRDTYLYRGEDRVRSFREWRVLADLRRRFAAVPVPFAARYRRSGAFYTADLITFRIPGVRPLSRVLRERSLGGSWRTVGEAIAALHNANVYHPDLNAHNVLIDEGGGVYVVDFDKAYVVAGPGAGNRLGRNVRRLQVSLLKLKKQFPGFAYEEEDSVEWVEAYSKNR